MQTAHQKPFNAPLETVVTDEHHMAPEKLRGRGGVVVTAIPLLVVVLAAATLAAAAHAQVAKPCGAAAGPTAHVAGVTFDRFLV